MAQTKYSLLSILRGQSLEAWHKSAVWFQALSVSVCLAMIICFILSSSRGGALGTTELFSGQCSHAVNINRALQAVLALLAIGISVSFDFFMRLCSSPTVEELRRAHSEGRSFDIAVHSLRNIRQISRWRMCGWIILILLTIPIQMFFHSIAFICFSSTDYSLVFVSEAFTTGHAFAYPGVALLGRNAFRRTSGLQSEFDEILPNLRTASSEWDRLEVSECSHTYSKDIGRLQNHRNLLLVVGTGPDADAEGWTGAQVWNHTTPPAYTRKSINEYDPEMVNSLWSFATNCVTHRVGSDRNRQYSKCTGSDFRTTEDWDEGTVANSSTACFLFDGWNINSEFQNVSVKYCLSEPYSPPCKVYVSNLFLLVTLLCTLLGCACSNLIARLCWHEETCQSLGDALQVFLKHGEAFVQVSCARPIGYSQESTAPSSMRWTPVKKWDNTRKLWGQAVSKKRWLATYVPIGILLSGGSAALGFVSGKVAQVPNPRLCKESKIETYSYADTITRLGKT